MHKIIKCFQQQKENKGIISKRQFYGLNSLEKFKSTHKMWRKIWVKFLWQSRCLRVTACAWKDANFPITFQLSQKSEVNRNWQIDHASLELDQLQMVCICGSCTLFIRTSSIQTFLIQKLSSRKSIEKWIIPCLPQCECIFYYVKIPVMPLGTW